MILFTHEGTPDGKGIKLIVGTYVGIRKILSATYLIKSINYALNMTPAPHHLTYVLMLLD